MLLPIEMLENTNRDSRSPVDADNGFVPYHLELPPTQAKSFLIINDVVGVLTQGVQLRVSQILDRLERAGVTWFDMTLMRTRRVEQLRTILYTESLRKKPRVERTRAGVYRIPKGEISAKVDKGEAV